MVIDVKHRDKESRGSAAAFTIPVGSHYVQLELYDKKDLGNRAKMEIQSTNSGASIYV